MINEEKQYEYIASVITDRLNRARDAFKLFLQLFAAIVGGSIWLSSQVTVSPSAKHTYSAVSNMLVWLVILVTGIMVLEALRGWWGYRKALSKFDGGEHPIPPPTPRALVTEVVMVACMIAAGIIFTLFNPFAITLK